MRNFGKLLIPKMFGGRILGRVYSTTASRMHTQFRQFGKRYAVKLGDFERSLISSSLTRDELKRAFDMMDKNNGK